NLLCRLLCSVSVACMHNKLRPGCGVGGRAQLSSPASPMGRDLAGGVTGGHLRRHRRWVGIWRAGWVRKGLLAPMAKWTMARFGCPAIAAGRSAPLLAVY